MPSRLSKTPGKHRPACVIEACDRSARRRGWCDAHYEQWRRHGDPLQADMRRLKPPARCVLEGCEALALARGWCSMHYQRWKLTGEVGEAAAISTWPTGVPCRVENCEAPVRHRGWCEKHYERWRSHGDPLVVLKERHPTEEARREAARTSGREWARRERERDPEGVRRRRREWASGPAGRLYNAKSAAERRTALSELDRDYIDVLVGDPCSYCGVAGRVGVDHIVPVSSGGVGDWANLTGACRSCNCSKQAKPMLGYLLRRS